MKRLNKFFKTSFKNIPPTRGIRYKQSLHCLIQKNSYKVPIDNSHRCQFQTFEVLWDNNYTKFQLINTTPKSNMSRLKLN